MFRQILQFYTTVDKVMHIIPSGMYMISSVVHKLVTGYPPYPVDNENGCS